MTAVSILRTNELYMTIKSQVCSLELARRLKELGVKQSGIYIWWLPLMGDDGECETRLSRGSGKIRRQCSDWCSAFTVAELGKMLPKQTYMFGEVGGKYRIAAWPGVQSMFEYARLDHFDSDTEADARAKMVIYLLENKLITP